MNFFEENKALIITVLLFSVLLLAMYNINISNSNQKVRETLIQLNDLRQETEEQEKEVPKPEPKQPETERPELRTHQAYNQNQQENKKNFDSRLDEILQKNAADQEASSEAANPTTSGEKVLDPNRQQKKQEGSEGNDRSNNLSTEEGTDRNSSISFSLTGRQAIDIPNPIYTCDTAGKVVVNITVNEDGKVVGTAINKGSSTSTNECLTSKAEQYARSARFTKFPGKSSQPGTITYYFQE